MHSRHVAGGSAFGPTMIDLRPSFDRQNSAMTSSAEKSANALFRTAVLTAWDNILGPSAVARWNLLPPAPAAAAAAAGDEGKDAKIDDSFKLPEPEAFHPFIANHTLNGEICRDFSGGNIDVKISTFDLNDVQGGSRSIASSTFIFSSKTSAGHDATHSLALLFDAGLLPTYFVIHDIVAQRMKRMIGKYRVLAERSSLRQTALTALTDDLYLLREFVSHWRRFGLHTSDVSCGDTFFSRHHACDPPFLRMALASHLATGGCSVVVGACPHKANLMIGTLSLLLTSRERSLCTYLQPTKYFPGLLVQGILKDSVEAGNSLTTDLLLAASFPTTIIDMDNLRVRRTSSISKHRSLRRKMLLEELEHLYGRRRHRHPMEEGEEEDDVAGDASSPFQPVVDSDAPRFRKAAFDESIVDAFLKQMNDLNLRRGGAKEAVIDDDDDNNHNNDNLVGRKDGRGERREKADEDEDEDDEEEELRLEEVEDAVGEFRSRLFSTTKSFVRLVFDHLSEKNGEENDANDGGVGGGNDNVNTSAHPGKSSPGSVVSSGKFKVSNGNTPLLSSSPRGVLKVDFILEFLENHDLKAKDDLILLVSTAERFKPGFNHFFSAHFGSLFKNSEWNS